MMARSPNQKWMKAGALALVLAAVGCGATTGNAPDLADAQESLTAAAPVYTDALASGWADWSWATRNLANASPVASGTRSISVTYGPWKGLYFHNAGLSTSGLSTLDFQVNGGANNNPALTAYVTKGGKAQTTVAVAQYCTGKTIPSNSWTPCSIPLSALGAAGVTLDGVVIQEGAGKTLQTLYIDSIQFNPATTIDAGSTTTPDAGTTLPPDAGSSTPPDAGTTTPPSSGGVWIYRDAMVSPWTDQSWAAHNLSNTSPVAAGSYSISTTMGAWQALDFATTFSTSGHQNLVLAVNGGPSGGGVALRARALVNGTWQLGTALGPTCAGGAVKANAWVTCTVPLSTLAPANSTISAIAIQEDSGKTLPTLYFDEIGIDTTPSSSPGSTPDAGSTTAPPDAGISTPPDAGTTTPPDAGTTTPPDAGTTTPPDAGSPPVNTGKESWVWVYTDYSNVLNSIISHKSSFTHLSPTFYSINYNYQSGVAYYATCPTSSGYDCASNGSNNFNGLTTKQFTDQARAAGLATVPAIYAGGANGGTDQGMTNLLDNVNGAGDNFINAMTTEAVNNGYAGYNLDWEASTAGSAYADKFVSFVNKFKAALAPHGMSLSVDAIVSNINGTWCSSNNGFIDLAKLNNSSIDRVIIEDYVSSFGTATTSCQNVVMSSSSPASCDYTVTGMMNMMCSPNLSFDKAVIGLDADPNSTNPVAGQAMSALHSYGFTRVAIWPQAPFMTTSGISPSGSTWYSLLQTFLTQ
ncbi:MAG: hypothetical protein JST54_03875 [Deltaproteobacteria bacterium]|nr:hypothetical protein [Deltaproteobacteria bacterium]